MGTGLYREKYCIPSLSLFSLFFLVRGGGGGGEGDTYLCWFYDFGLFISKLRLILYGNHFHEYYIQAILYTGRTSISGVSKLNVWEKAK